VDRIRVLLIDRQRIFLAGMCSFLEMQEDIAVVGHAEDGRTGCRLAAELSPDVIMIDVNLPELNGMEVTRDILNQIPKTRVLACSERSEPELVHGMLKAGADGYLLKSGDPHEIPAAIRAVAKGGGYLCADVAGLVVDVYRRSPLGTEEAPRPSLSWREREVLRLLAEGKTTRDIAVLLQVGRKTVETYRHRVMRKLGLRSLPALVKYAIHKGLIIAGR
jgi:DNA-binding NarL/FixJ family response regulator